MKAFQKKERLKEMLKKAYGRHSERQHRELIDELTELDDAEDVEDEELNYLFDAIAGALL